MAGKPSPGAIWGSYFIDPESHFFKTFFVAYGVMIALVYCNIYLKNGIHDANTIKKKELKSGSTCMVTNGHKREWTIYFQDSH